MIAAQGAGAASAPPVPSTAGAEANKLTGLFANRLAQSNAISQNALGTPGGRADFVMPDFSTAVGIGGVSEALASFLSALPTGGGNRNVDPNRGLSNPDAGAFFGG